MYLTRKFDKVSWCLLEWDKLTRRDRIHLYVCWMIKRPNDAEHDENFCFTSSQTHCRAFLLALCIYAPFFPFCSLSFAFQETFHQMDQFPHVVRGAIKFAPYILRCVRERANREFWKCVQICVALVNEWVSLCLFWNTAFRIVPLFSVNHATEMEISIFFSCFFFSLNYSKLCDTNTFEN